MTGPEASVENIPAWMLSKRGSGGVVEHVGQAVVDCHWPFVHVRVTDPNPVLPDSLSGK
jgi:hypothetical protein